MSGKEEASELGERKRTVRCRDEQREEKEQSGTYINVLFRQIPPVKERKMSTHGRKAVQNSVPRNHSCKIDRFVEFPMLENKNNLAWIRILVS